MLGNMLTRFCYTKYFQANSNQHSWIFIHLLVDYLSRMLECEAGACLIIALMIDGDDTNNTWLNKKLDTAKVEGGDVCQPCLGVIG